MLPMESGWPQFWQILMDGTWRLRGKEESRKRKMERVERGKWREWREWREWKEEGSEEDRSSGR